jgi:hypothetical protein
VDQAKKVLKNAIIGLVIILSSFAIVSFILNALTGSFTGNNGNDDDNDNYPGIGALGQGVIRSVYPAPGQTDVVMNTSIIVTFREKIKADTVCDNVGADGKCAAGAKIIPENIRIFKTENGDAGQSAGDCAANITDVYCASADNETFIFQPKNFLAGEAAGVWHSVILSTGLKKADDSAAFNGLSNGFEWSFNVSDKVDLSPPRVLSGGVFPGTDDYADEKNPASAAVAAAGTITVTAIPQIRSEASVSAPVKDPAGSTWPEAEIKGIYNCLEDGTLNVLIESSGNHLTAQTSGINGAVSGDDVGDNLASVGCGLTLSPKTGNFSAGNKWKITVKAEKRADILRVGSVEYVFSDTGGAGKIKVGTVNETVANLAAVLNSGNDLYASIAVGNPAQANIRAQKAGSAGNNIEIAYDTDKTAALAVAALSGGKDEGESITIKGRADKARNAVVQVNFNEAINPATISGNAAEVSNYIKIVNANPAAAAKGGACQKDADCISFKCNKQSLICEGDNSYLEGKFLLSNLYRTVEFISNNECGINACGEKVYCLPENSRLAVKLAAAGLEDCGEDNCARKSPYNICDNEICKNQTGNNYPLSKSPLSGIADMALNSLDGNRDGLSAGPEAQSGRPAYNENSDSAGSPNGDDFTWSFFISDVIDLTPPTISVVIPPSNGNAANLNTPLEIDFSELMLSSSLDTGERIIVNSRDKQVIHKLINLKSYSTEPVGYWITKSDVDDKDGGAPPEPVSDGEADWTKGFINHSSFTGAAKYRAQAGSGVKDIYQNCYLPCRSDSCAASKESPSCCSDTPIGSDQCDSIFK